MAEMRTSLTTSANSGIGLASVSELARRGFRAVGDPVRCATVIGTALTTKWPRTGYLVGRDAQALVIWNSLTPTEVKDRIVRFVISL